MVCLLGGNYRRHFIDLALGNAQCLSLFRTAITAQTRPHNLRLHLRCTVTRYGTIPTRRHPRQTVELLIHQTFRQPAVNLISFKAWATKCKIKINETKSTQVTFTLRKPMSTNFLQQHINTRITIRQIFRNAYG